MQVPASITRSSIVFLTGAGASVPLGRFTTLQFWEHLKRILVRRIQGNDPPEVKELIQDLLVWGAPVATDIEKVLSRLQNNADEAGRLGADSHFVKQVLYGSSGTLAQYQRANEIVRDAVQDEVINHYTTVDPEQAAALYKALFVDYISWFGEIPGVTRTIPIFTLNYDRAVEAAASRLGVPYVDGLSDRPGATERHWSRANFEHYHEAPQLASIALVKLHGSVRWGWHGGVGGDIVELSAGVGRNPGAITQVVLYPTELPKPLYVEPFRTAYRIFRECMSSARALFVIGCSLRDLEIRTSISDAMDDNHDLHVVILRPEADHKRTAGDLDVEEARLAAVRKPFEMPQQDGKEYLVCLRGFAQVACGVGSLNSADRLFRYGQTYDRWPWPSREDLDAVLSKTSSVRLRHRFGSRG